MSHLPKDRDLFSPLSFQASSITMKRFAAVAVIIGVTSAFAPRPNIASSRASSAFYATRREFAQQSAAVLGGALYFGNAAPAFAGGPRGADYVPKFDDLKVLYQLGMSLDRLVNKFSVEETVEAGLDGVREFNRQPNFYPGYAKNYISKSILNNADGDPRVGYIKQVSFEAACETNAITTRIFANFFFRPASSSALLKTCLKLDLRTKLRGMKL